MSPSLVRHALSLLALASFAPSVAAQLVPSTVDVNGVQREYLVYLPAGYDGSEELPVLLTYHGGDMTSQSMLLMVDQRPQADVEGYILVYPQGLPDLEGVAIWDSVGPWSIGTDEIGFTAAMIDALEASYDIDESRVYACGYSNGANMVWELACYLSDRIAAVGAVAGSMWEWTEDLCAPTRPVPVLSIHGTQDFYNPWGGLPPWSLGLVEASEYFVQNAGGSLTPTIVDLPNLVPGDGSTVDRYTWSGGDACVTIEHFRVQNGGHDWPGKFGNMDIDSNDEIWSFVSQYSLNGLIGCNDCAIETLGAGAGGANIGTLSSPSTPSLSSMLQLDYAGFHGASVGLLLIGSQGIEAQVLGGTVYVGIFGANTSVPISTQPDGSGGLSGPLGSDPSLAGVTIYAQAGILDASQSAGVALSNGLAITLCN